MAEPLSPEQLQELLAGYVLGNLSPEEAESLRQLIVANPEILNEVHQLQEVLSTMPYALPETMPPERLRAAILSTAAEEPHQAPMRNRWRKRSVLALGSVAAVMLLALGVNNVQLRQQLTATKAQVTQQRDLIAMLQEPKTHLISLKGMDQMASASGSAVITPGHSEAILVLQNLPDLPSDRYYCLWAMVDGQKIAVKELKPNAQGKVFVKVPMSSNSGIAGLAVTVEVAPTLPQSPKGPMVMTSSI